MTEGGNDTWLADLIREVPDFPRPGVSFKDVTPLLADAGAFARVVDLLATPFDDGPVDTIVGIESRGFILAAPVAHQLGASFVPARKAGKLPGPCKTVSYQLEYGEEELQLHEDAIAPGDRVLIIDDVLATGGTAAATIELIEQLGGEVVGLAFLLELTFLDGGAKLPGRPRRSLLEY